jgi:hypothetical protein
MNNAQPTCLIPWQRKCAKTGEPGNFSERNLPVIVGA